MCAEKHTGITSHNRYVLAKLFMTALQTQVTWELEGADSPSSGGSRTLKVAPRVHWRGGWFRSVGLENAAYAAVRTPKRPP